MTKDRLIINFMDKKKVFILVILLLLIYSSEGRAQVLSLQSSDSLNNKPTFSVKIGGRIKLLAVYDFKGLQNYEAFDIFRIPVGDSNKADGRFFMGAEQSRIKIDGRLQTNSLGEVKAYFEGDFAGGSSNNVFRIRHAYVKFGKFLFGQTWSVFADENVFPVIVDNDGPVTSIFERNPQARFFTNLSKSTELNVSLEYAPQLIQKSTDLDSLVAPTYVSAPDLAMNIINKGDWGHIQLALLGRMLSYKSSGETKHTPGWGAILSSQLFTGKFSNFLIQAVYGQGIEKYINGLNFANIDAAPDGKGNLIALPVYGGFIAYQFPYDSKNFLSSTLVYGYTGIHNNINDIYRSTLGEGNYCSVNINCKPISSLQLMLEGLYGNRTNYQGLRGDAWRVQFMTQYDF